MNTIDLLRDELNLISEKEFEKNNGLCNPDFVKKVLCIEKKMYEAFLKKN